VFWQFAAEFLSVIREELIRNIYAHVLALSLEVGGKKTLGHGVC
jgi:hypothetical protein